MCFSYLSVRTTRRSRRFAFCLACVLLAGCDPTRISDQTRQIELDGKSQFQLPSPVAKFAGRVTIDGKPPKKNCRLFVILNDPSHPEKNVNGGEQMLFSACDSNGNFAFSTYGLQDGVIPGEYVVTFVELHFGTGNRINAFFLPTSRLGPSPDRYRQPDELKNLYNDPDKNAKNPEFNIDLQPPGYAHYQFNLAVAGQKPVVQPGPNAVTGLPPRR
jgi:hypothetical protein